MTMETMSENFGEPAPTVVEMNCETGEQTTRLMTAEEIAQRTKDAEEYAAYQAEQSAVAEAKAAAKAAAETKLAVIGLTPEEIAALS